PTARCRSPSPSGTGPRGTATVRNWCRSGTTWNGPDRTPAPKARPDRDRSATMIRRDFLKAALATGGSGLLAPRLWAFDAVSVENPLGVYPSRDWEKVYRDQYRYDSSFTWVCAPNDTHMCRLRAFVRNGVIRRSEQNYDHDRCGDLYGNKATKAWNPRGCPKGYTMHRRVYGPYRLRGPVIRKGWKEWADAGFPSLSDHPDLREKYRFDNRG